MSNRRELRDGLFARARSPHVVVLASAGTGKTHKLSSWYIELLARGVEPRTILATTFTRKAAGEILERILSRLSAAAVDPVQRTALNAAIGAHLDGPAWQDLTTRVARQVHRLSIGTIDSFFASVMKGFALDLDVAPGAKVVDDERDRDLRSRAVLDSIQRSGLEHKELTLLVRMLSSGRLRRGVHEGILRAVRDAYNAYLAARGDRSVWEVFGAGATAPGDADLASIVSTIRAIDPPKTKEGEPNKHFAANLAKLATFLERRRWSDVLELGLVSSVIQGLDKFNRVAIEPAVRAAIQSAIGAASRAVLAQLRDRNVATHDFMSRFDAAYGALKRDRNVIRFEDVPRAILDAGAQGRAEDLYFRLDGRIDHLLLDEFQDTSLDQFEILKPLLDEILATGDASRTVLCVGDVKQSLYSWRGAEPELLPALPVRWPQFQEESLSENRRSSPVILDAVNRVFEHIDRNPVVQGIASAQRFSQGFKKHTAFHADLPGQVRLTEPPDREDDSDKAGALAAFIATRVQELRATAPDASIAILTRTNKPIPGLILALREAGVPAVGERGNPLTDSPATAAAVSALHLADHPADSAALFHVATSPLGEVLGVQWRRDKTLNEVEGRWIAARLRTRVERIGLRALLETWQRRLAARMDAAAHARFDQLVDLAGEFEESTGGRPDDFVRLVRARAVEPPGRSPAAVRVMTIHAAKGLEFDAVILPELNKEWKVMPGSVLIDRRDERDRRDPLSPVRAATTYANKEVQAIDPALGDLFQHTWDRLAGEELSSLYVAMTRARRYLEFILPKPERNSSAPTAQRVILAALDSAGLSSPAPWHTGLRGTRAISDEERVVQWAPAGPVPAGRLARRSPSGLEGDARQDLSELWKADTPHGTPAAKDRGTAIHAIFEQIAWLDDGPPERKAMLTTLTQLGVDPEQAEVWSRECVGSLTGDIASALSRKRYEGRPGSLELRREWDFAMRETVGESQFILSGAIDRLVVAMEGGKARWAEVLDFKSDDVRTEAALADRVAHYRPQIEAYKRAVAALFHLPAEQVSGLLLFTGPGKVVGV